jgi:hypothetical protein
VRQTLRFPQRWEMAATIAIFPFQNRREDRTRPRVADCEFFGGVDTLVPPMRP